MAGYSPSEMAEELTEMKAAGLSRAFILYTIARALDDRFPFSHEMRNHLVKHTPDNPAADFEDFFSDAFYETDESEFMALILSAVANA